MKEEDAKFVGTIPALYDEHLGPAIFAPHARELARRVAPQPARGAAQPRLLELACGTGVLTRALLESLPPACEIVATDLNEAMVERARAVAGDSPRARSVTWRTADMMELPFEPGRFDAAACQFGLMFVPDKARALRETARVLRPGGAFHFATWCALDENPFAAVTHRLIASFFPSNPPSFYDVPFSLPDPQVLAALLRDAGFESIEIERRELPVVAKSAEHFARGLVEGNPVIAAIREAGLAPGPIVAAVAQALRAFGGDAPFRSMSRALHASARFQGNTRG